MCANPENMKIYNAVRNVPKEALKPIQAGRLKGMSDINPMWRIKMLTEQFGVCGFGWYVEEVERWSESGKPVYNGSMQLLGHEIAVFAKIHLYVKLGDEWSKPIIGLGGASFMPFEKGGFYTDDEAYKKAYTDAISVACKSLGIGADVYFEKDSTKYAANQIDNSELPFPEAVGACNHAPPAPISPVNFASKPTEKAKLVDDTDIAGRRAQAAKFALPNGTEYPGAKLGDVVKLNRAYFMELLKNPPDTATGEAAAIVYDWIMEKKKGATA